MPFLNILMHKRGNITVMCGKIFKTFTKSWSETSTTCTVGFRHHKNQLLNWNEL